MKKQWIKNALWGLAGILGVGVVTCTVVVIATAPPPEPTPTSPIPTSTPVPAPVQAGCTAARQLRPMVEALDAAALDSAGPALMEVAVSTGDPALTLVMGVVSLALIDYGRTGDPAHLQVALDGFDAYLETCARLGAQSAMPTPTAMGLRQRNVGPSLCDVRFTSG